MTKEEIDVMWQLALRESVRNGEEFTRYRFAEMVAAKEREACAKLWLPIETAPKDGSLIILANSHGAWMGKCQYVYQSGYRPKNPWASMLLNNDHMAKNYNLTPTHWMPLPAAPSTTQGTNND